MKTAIFALLLSPLAFAQLPLFPYGVKISAEGGCDSACVNEIIDSLRAGLGDSIVTEFIRANDSVVTSSVRADSVRALCFRVGGAGLGGTICQTEDGQITVTADLITLDGRTIIDGSVGFYGANPSVQCILPFAAPPNPVTEAQARAEYDLALQNCLDESGVNLVNTP